MGVVKMKDGVHRFRPRKRFPGHASEGWTTSFANAFRRMMSGTYNFPDAPVEIESLIRELVRDEMDKASL